MAKKCNACGRFTNPTEGVKCSRCVYLYHKACVKIPNDAQPLSSWVCPDCKALAPRKDNTETPVRGERSDCTRGSPELDLSAEVLKELKLIRRDMQSFRTDLGALREEVSAVRSVVEGFGGRMDALESRMDSLESKCAELSAMPDMSALLATIEQLKSQLDERDRELYCGDVEITGIPEERGENVAHLARAVASKLGVTLEERDLVSAERPPASRRRRRARARSCCVWRGDNCETSCCERRACVAAPLHKTWVSPRRPQSFTSTNVSPASIK